MLSDVKLTYQSHKSKGNTIREQVLTSHLARLRTKWFFVKFTRTCMLRKCEKYAFHSVIAYTQEANVPYRSHPLEFINAIILQRLRVERLHIKGPKIYASLGIKLSTFDVDDECFNNAFKLLQKYQQKKGHVMMTLKMTLFAT